MREELAYALVTPYSLRKSRTGGIIARLVSRTGLDLVAGRIFAPSAELASEYAGMVVTHRNARHQKIQELIRSYVLAHLSPDLAGRRARCLMLLFRGEAAVAKIREVAGNIATERTSGETVRDTYGDYIVDEKGEVRHFEPAILVGQDPEEVRAHLELWARYSDTDGSGLDKVVQFPPRSNVEQTLVLLKPDNFRFPSSRPGGIIDLFSRTGLFIIAFRVLRLSVAQAEEFYRPVLPVLEEILRKPAGARAREILSRELGLDLSAAVEKELGALLGPVQARHNWESIIEYMCGRRPSATRKEDRLTPGPEKCIALVYQGVDAVRKIRSVLGPTDPQKAPPGSIRREFGQTIMINSAHASDSPENAQREMRIVQVWENDFKAEVEKSFSSR